MCFQLFFLFAFVVFANANVPPTEIYPHLTVLNQDQTMRLYWKYDDTNITFEIHGNTFGWVGMGISPSGAMAGADIVVGWVREGEVNVQDFHGIGNQLPVLDPEQNVEMLGGLEKEGWTVIKYRRELAACEPNYDLPITGDTLNIIYAFGENDPTDDALTGPDYHNTTRGRKSVLILDATNTDESAYPDGETHDSFDLLNENFHLPAERTYYNCRLHKMPEFSSKQHLVKVEPVIQPGNELYVHHIVIFQCIGNVNDSSIGINTRCYSNNMPPDFATCQFVIQAWATGGGAMYYPNHVGFPLGEDDSPKYVVVETHYDNPMSESGIVDSSGLRLVYTSQLRQYDAGVLETGLTVSGLQHIIPPNAESYLNYGECSTQCLEQSLSRFNVDKLNVFGTLLHSHLLGTGLTLRHFRGNEELPYISKDSSYDFNYQETRMLREEREILPGDSLQVVCNSKTKGFRTKMSVGGIDTEKEMCIVYVYYYPKIPLSFCETAPEFTSFISYFGITGTETINEPVTIFTNIHDMMITAPEDIANQTMGEFFNSMTWNDETANKLSEDMKNIMRIQNCRASKFIPGLDYNVSAPTIDYPYVEKELTCLSTGDQSTTPENNNEETTTVGPDNEDPLTTPGYNNEETTTGGASTLSLSLLIYSWVIALTIVHL